MPGHQRTARNRRHLAVLLGCALLLRALIPAGWMPSAQGGFQLELCTDGGPDAAFEQAARQAFDQAVAGAAGHPDDRSDGPRTDQPCAFAGIALTGLQPESSLLPPPAPAPASAPPPSLRAAIGQGLAAPPPPSTGPPAFS